MKPLHRLFFAALLGLSACISPVLAAPPMRIRNVSPMPMHLAPVPFHANTPSALARMLATPAQPGSSAPTTPTTATQPLTPAQLQILQQRLLLETLRAERRLVNAEDMLLVNRMMAANYGANPYGATANPQTPIVMPMYSPGYGGGGSYSSPTNPYASSSASPYSASYTPQENSSAPKAMTPYSSMSANDSKSYEAPAQKKETNTILTGLGISNVNGRVNWPQGLQMLKPAKESRELRQQAEADFQIVADRMVHGSTSAVFIQEGNDALDRLDHLLYRNKGSMSLAAYAEGEQFLAKLRHALQSAQANY